jgi:hypothetical protein
MEHGSEKGLCPVKRFSPALAGQLSSEHVYGVIQYTGLVPFMLNRYLTIYLGYGLVTTSHPDGLRHRQSDLWYMLMSELQSIDLEMYRLATLHR